VKIEIQFVPLFNKEGEGRFGVLLAPRSALRRFLVRKPAIPSL
jgi:hypothetical protein